MAFVAAIPLALKVAAVAVTALSHAKAGKDEKKSADSEAAQLARRAAARRAESGFAAREERRQARLDQSRARALIAAGGGNMADKTIIDRMGDLHAEGEIGALSRLYEGTEESEGLLDAAANRRREGKAARSAGFMRGASTVLSALPSLKSKYSG